MPSLAVPKSPGNDGLSHEETDETVIVLSHAGRSTTGPKRSDGDGCEILERFHADPVGTHLVLKLPSETPLDGTVIEHVARTSAMPSLGARSRRRAPSGVERHDQRDLTRPYLERRSRQRLSSLERGSCRTGTDQASPYLFPTPLKDRTIIPTFAARRCTPQPTRLRFSLRPPQRLLQRRLLLEEPGRPTLFLKAWLDQAELSPEFTTQGLVSLPKPPTDSTTTNDFLQEFALFSPRQGPSGRAYHTIVLALAQNGRMVPGRKPSSLASSTLVPSHFFPAAGVSLGNVPTSARLLRRAGQALWGWEYAISSVKTNLPRRAALFCIPSFLLPSGPLLANWDEPRTLRQRNQPQHQTSSPRPGISR